MEEKIGIIKEKFTVATMEQLPFLIEEYKADLRIGVQKEIEKAWKKMEALKKEKARTESLWKYEREYASCTYICGIDEVGRGPLAGPVVAGAVILPKDCDILYISFGLYGFICEDSLSLFVAFFNTTISV